MNRYWLVIALNDEGETVNAFGLWSREPSAYKAMVKLKKDNPLLNLKLIECNDFQIHITRFED